MCKAGERAVFAGNPCFTGLFSLCFTVCSCGVILTPHEPGIHLTAPCFCLRRQPEPVSGYPVACPDSGVCHGKAHRGF